MSKRKGGVADVRGLLEARYGKEFLRVLEDEKRPQAGHESFADFMQRLEAGEGNKTTELFTIPPCSMTEECFSRRYGLIRQVCGKSPRHDRFRNMDMKADAVKFVALLHQQEVINSMRARGDPLKELKRRGAEDLILCRMRYFTKPREGSEGTRDLYVDPVDDDNDTDDPHGACSTNSEGSSSGDINRSLFVDPEAINERSRRERGDFKVYVFCDGERELRLVVDCKTLAEPRDILQAAMYALPEATHAKKENLRPVYLMVWDATKWYYGILEIDGFVEVIAGKLVEESLNGFPDVIPAEQKDPEGEFAANFTPSATKDKIRTTFAKWKMDMEYEKLSIPDGRHPVGKLFRIWKIHSFPRFLEDTNMSKGKRVFYEGLLKVLVGRDVASWDKEKVEERWISRALSSDQIKLADKFGLRKSLSHLFSTMSEKLVQLPGVESDDSDVN